MSGRPRRKVLNPDALVVRGGQMRSADLSRSAEAAFYSPQLKGQWAISVASLPGETAEEIVRLSPQIISIKAARMS